MFCGGRCEKIAEKRSNRFKDGAESLGDEPKKMLITVRWLVRGVVGVNFLPPAQTIVADIHREEMKTVGAKVLPALVNWKFVILLYENVASATRRRIKNVG